MAEKLQIKPQDLKRYIPLNTLSDAAMKSLMPSVKMFSAQKGTALFNKGEKVQFHFYLVSGKVILDDEEGDKETLTGGSERAKFPIAHQFPRKVSAIVADKINFLRIESQKIGQALSNKGGSGDIEVSELSDEGNDDDWMSQLLRSRVFQLIPPGNIQRVMMCMEEQKVKAGDVVISQGEEGDYFYLINRGHCRVERDQGEGKPPIELARLGPGASFGEDALLAGKKRSATITMTEDGRLLRLSKDNFIELIKAPFTKPFGYPEAKEKVAQGAVWLDVREQEMFEKGHLEGSINVPFSLMRFQAESLDPDRHYVVCCQDGRTSHAASYLLTSRGLSATVLDKGLQVVPGTELGREDEEQSLEQPKEETIQKTADAGESSQLVGELKQQIARLEKDKYVLEEKRVQEVTALDESMEQLRSEHGEVLTELLELRKQTEAGSANAEELEQAQQEIARFKQALEQAKQDLSDAQSELDEGDEALREQVKGYLEEKLQLEEELQQLRKSQKPGATGKQANRELTDELDHLRKELAQAEMALDTEISSRLEMEEELEQLKATMEH